MTEQDDALPSRDLQHWHPESGQAFYHRDYKLVATSIEIEEDPRQGGSMVADVVALLLVGIVFAGAMFLFFGSNG